jgi:hypothetical protein
MDYSIRSLYHIFFPIALFIFYVIDKYNESYHIPINFYAAKIGNHISIEYKKLAKAVIFIILLIYLSCDLFLVFDNGGPAFMINYYYSLLSANGAAGEAINGIKDKYNIHSIACGDAGILAFHADIDSLDLFKLGSAVLTHNGLNEAYSLYKPDILFLISSEEDSYNEIFEEDRILEDVKGMHEYKRIGRVVLNKNYYYWVYSNKNIPELFELFEKSYSTNYRSRWQILRDHIFSPPWSLWHE